ncbi:MAG TPA: hypothetical protein VFK05_19210 [Polyangiaceae bacterium]|nr:hypothetical protein [Polyangiaceae bacterium]
MPQEKTPYGARMVAEQLEKVTRCLDMAIASWPAEHESFDPLTRVLSASLARLEELPGARGHKPKAEVTKRDVLSSTAHHEAAHAVAQTRLGFTCLGVSIGLGGLEGLASHYDDDMAFAVLGADGILVIPEQATRDLLTTYYAGYCAASIEIGDGEKFGRYAAADDFAKADELREKLGLSEAECIATAFAFVREPKNWRAIQAVAAELIEHRKLDADEVTIIIDIADGEAVPADLVTYRQMRPTK